MGIALQTMTNELTHVFLLSVGAFFISDVFNANLYVFRLSISLLEAPKVGKH